MGKAGLTDRDVYVALLNVAWRYGRMIPAGVRVSISVRDLALAAGVSKATASNAINRLMVEELIRRDGRGSGTECGAFVLMVRDEVGHSSTDLVPLPSVPIGRVPRLRWRGLGKTPGAILDALDAYGSSTLQDLAGYLGKNRPRDLRPHIRSLLEAEVVECDDDTYRLADDHRQALDEERQIRGELEAERRDRSRYDLEREAYREQLERRKLGESPDRATKSVRTSARRGLREADGTIGELVCLSSAYSAGDKPSEVWNDTVRVERSSVA
jgi:DNA-binding transcriptional ArsR family regulator